MTGEGGRAEVSKPLSYVLPLRRGPCRPDFELTPYLEWLSPRVELIVVDGSDPATFDAHARAWEGLSLRHVSPDPQIVVLNGKVAGVLTGLRLARYDRVVVADDDVRYDDGVLWRVVRLLDSADLVWPQNFFDPCPWHARWDTARTLLNRAVGRDYPGTLAVRRSAVPEGYDGNVLFENLELIRTVRARGGRVAAPLDCYVRRLPPTARHFWSQRVRQAYDDLAQPPRLIGALLVVPLITTWMRQGRWDRLACLVGGPILLAEMGRQRAGGHSVFPRSASAFAPIWLLERGTCSWLALANLFLRGGCPYGGTVIRRAASPPRQLRRRARMIPPNAAGDAI